MSIAGDGGVGGAGGYGATGGFALAETDPLLEPPSEEQTLTEQVVGMLTAAGSYFEHIALGFHGADAVAHPVPEVGEVGSGNVFINAATEAGHLFAEGVALAIQEANIFFGRLSIGVNGLDAGGIDADAVSDNNAEEEGKVASSTGGSGGRGGRGGDGGAGGVSLTYGGLSVGVGGSGGHGALGGLLGCGGEEYGNGVANDDTCTTVFNEVKQSLSTIVASRRREMGLDGDDDQCSGFICGCWA
mmetsp:Transcript_14197/g.35933  ORF Transcript_14197/g.35933 Transcript_14197/m.35933 type:complete len:244 (+) Transcript_14197:1-732(+)